MEIFEEETNKIKNKTENKLKNKGTGAGGINTNINGKNFEKNTNVEEKLLNENYDRLIIKKNNNSKYNYYLTKNYDDRKIIYLTQNGFKLYMNEIYNIKDIFKCPDEAYIIEYNNGKKVLKILEKKTQNVEGSVEEKLFAGSFIRELYSEMLENKFEIEYSFCVNKFLQNKLTSDNKKYILMNQLMKKHNISILFGNDDNYYETLKLNLKIE
jgi:hypothetical protein